jgi:hypothetical protein
MIFIKPIKFPNPMKHLLLLILAVVLRFSVANGQMVEAEVFFNQDPGFGNGFAIDLDDVATIDMIADIGASVLDPGTHRVYIRLRENNTWSHYTLAGLIKVNDPEIPGLSLADYFFNHFDDDQQTTILDFDQTELLNSEFSIAVNGLHTGKHNLFFRVSDGKRRSHYGFLPFHVVNPLEGSPVLAGGEFFVNQHPGLGSGNAVTFTAGNEIDTVLNLLPGQLQPGNNVLYYRVTDGISWSMYAPMRFTVPVAETSFTRGEFFINTEPGQGEARAISFETTAIIDRTFDLVTDTFPPGKHSLFFRLKNQHIWSHYGSLPFMVSFDEPNLPPLVSVKYHVGDFEVATGWNSVALEEPVATADEVVTIPIGSAELGNQKLYLRMADGGEKESHYSFIQVKVCESSNPVIAAEGNELTVSADIAPTGFQWLLNGENIPGATGASYTAVLSGMYSAIVYYDGNCAEESAPVEVTVIEVCEPINVRLEINENILTAVADFEPIAYQWLLDGDTIPDAIGAQFVADEDGSYSVVVYFGNDCTEVSEPLEYNAPPVANNTSGGFVFNSRVQYPFDNYSTSFLFNSSPLRFSDDYSNLFVFNTFAGHYFVSIEVDPPKSGDVTGAGLYARGSEVTVSFQPAEGYVFEHWANPLNREVFPFNPFKFTIRDRNIFLIASAKLKTYTEDHISESWKVFPNPASRSFKIESTEIIHHVRIIDLTGRVWYSERPEGQTTTVYSQGVVNGVYIVQIETSSGIHTDRVVIQQNGNR